MANLKDLRNRIDSVRSTRKITQAMKMVAASKLRRAQDKAEAARPYSEKLSKILSSLAIFIEDSELSHLMITGNGNNKTKLLVVVTSDRGLCGAFNSSIVRKVKNKITELEASKIPVKLICIGRKGSEVLRNSYSEKVISSYEISVTDKSSYSLAETVGSEIMRRFELGEFGSCSIYYNKFKSVISQVVTEQSIIPYESENIEEPKEENIFFEFEPDEQSILSELLPKNISIQIYKSILESGAGEQGARMAAMDNATRNAGEMIDKLTLSYNRQRQAIITRELIEIISGAEAL